MNDKELSQLGRLLGKAIASRMTPEQRRKRASHAASARWKHHREHAEARAETSPQQALAVLRKAIAVHPNASIWHTKALQVLADLIEPRS